jgi:hypothetical protein
MNGQCSVTAPTEPVCTDCTMTARFVILPIVCIISGYLQIIISLLMVRVPGYRSRGPGSIPGATRFSEK